jgi:hypothetical protein
VPLPDRLIYSADDVLAMLGDLPADATDTWWDGFFADRAKPIPFVVDWPDEMPALLRRATATARGNEAPKVPLIFEHPRSRLASAWLRAARLLPLQDSELMAQEQDLRDSPRLLTPGQPKPRR